MFAEVPRPWGLAGAMTIVVWLILAVAFVTDAVPTSSSEDWLYGVEARRAAWAEQLTARAAKAQAQVAARRAPARTPALAAGQGSAGQGSAARHCN
jgi:hypothetical protein